MEMIWVKSVYNDILKTVGEKKAETGGILLGDRSDFIVKKFIFDSTGSTSPGGYDPDVDFLNKIVKREWNENKLAFLGFVHSHPRGVKRLSGDYGNSIGDIGYIKTIFRAMPALDKLLVPIIYSTFDVCGLQIFPYIADRENIHNYQEAQLKIIPDHKPEKSEVLSDSAQENQSQEKGISEKANSRYPNKLNIIISLLLFALGAIFLFDTIKRND